MGNFLKDENRYQYLVIKGMLTNNQQQQHKFCFLKLFKLISGSYQC